MGISMEESGNDRAMEDRADLRPANEPWASAPPSPWRMWIRRVAVAGIVLLLSSVAILFGILELAKVEPQFYQDILQVDPQQQKRNGSEMERKILDLRNSVLIGDAWSATFKEAELNGWLAHDLSKKFPDLVPPQVTDPAVVIEKQAITLAFRCTAKPFRGIAIIKADVFMTGVVNQLGIKVQSIHSGKIPIPVAAVADEIAKQAKNAGIEIEWNTDEEDPIAILDIPESLTKLDDGSYIELQQIKVAEDAVSLLGVTHLADY